MLFQCGNGKALTQVKHLYGQEMVYVKLLTAQIEGIILSKVGTRLHPVTAVCFILVTLQSQNRWNSYMQTWNLNDRLGNAEPEQTVRRSYPTKRFWTERISQSGEMYM
jgi:hypothetical protein